MRRSLAIRIILAVTCMVSWAILAYFQPDSLIRILLLVAALIIHFPLHRIKAQRKTNRSFKIAVGFGAVSIFGLLFWHLHLLDRRGFDIPTAVCFSLAFIAQGFYQWSLVVDTSDQKLNELFGPLGQDSSR